mmetsp:Transcript_23398/g.34540  ORF Transcript_23398/g.34540 Transcript_23398/m.34540 type:complete len:166 (+) Transcript_23398:64-561(+)
MLRQRTNRIKSNKDEGVAIDEDEQDQIVQSLEQEATGQIRFLAFAFTVICRFASIACFLLVLLTPNTTTLTGRCHGIYSSMLHEYSNRKRHDNRNSNNNDKLFVSLTLLPSVFLFFVDGGTTTQWSLSLSNILTMVGAFYVRKEQRTMETSISDLKASKYRYKSL